MQPQPLTDDLNALLATERCSLVRHLEEAPPYLSPSSFRAWCDIESMAGTSDAHAAKLSALLMQLDLHERPNTFEQNVAFLHYLDVQALLPQLLDEKKRQIAAYERAVSHAHTGASGVATAQIETLLAENRDMLRRLETHLEQVPPDPVTS